MITSNEKSFLAHAMLFCATLLFASDAFAEIVFTVNSTLDQIDADGTDGECRTSDNTCTLRAAIMQANRLAIDSSKILLPAGTFVLTRPAVDDDADNSGDLNLKPAVDHPLTVRIVGAGAGMTIVDANHIDGVFKVAGNVAAYFQGLTIRNGASAANGGGIYNSGGLLMTDVIVSDNSASAEGGGIYNDGNLQIHGGSLSRNHSSLTGGAITNGMSRSLQLNAVIVDSNTSGEGGGIFNGGSAMIADSSFISNTAIDRGGGVFNLASLHTTGSVYSRNHGQNGGGIVNAQTLTMINCTIANNEARYNGGGFSHEDSAFSQLFNSTIVDNHADQDPQDSSSGAGVYVSGNNGGFFNIYNTLLARNVLDNDRTYDDCASPGAVVSHARNLIGETAGCHIAIASGSVGALNDVALLGPLQDNGGPTETIALLPGSNAINGSMLPQGCPDDLDHAIGTDQRGYLRTADACDIGAFEFSGISPDDGIFTNGFE